jgi:hypothetical protein
VRHTGVPMKIKALLLVLICALATAACSPIEADLCDAKCDCDGCSDREYDDCRNKYDDRCAEADRRDCLDQYDEWVACEDDTGRCSSDGWGTSCKDVREDFDNCVKR